MLFLIPLSTSCVRIEQKTITSCVLHVHYVVLNGYQLEYSFNTPNGYQKRIGLSVYAMHIFNAPAQPMILPYHIVGIIQA